MNFKILFPKWRRNFSIDDKTNSVIIYIHTVNMKTWKASTARVLAALDTRPNLGRSEKLKPFNNNLCKYYRLHSATANVTIFAERSIIIYIFEKFQGQNRLSLWLVVKWLSTVHQKPGGESYLSDWGLLKNDYECVVYGPLKKFIVISRGILDVSRILW